MSQQKQNIVSVGPGQMNQYKTYTSDIISSSGQCDFWSTGKTYADLNIVEYSGNWYRSIQAGNIGNQPDITPTYWRLEKVGVKDGDICLVNNGNKSDTQQRIAGVWRSLANQPLRISLVDGQLTPAVAVQFNAASFPFAVIDYTIRRGSGHGRKQRGRFIILNDGTGTLNYSLEYEEIGTDVEVTMTPVLVGGWVQMQYTSVDNGGVAIEFGYDLKGWV